MKFFGGIGKVSNSNSFSDKQDLYPRRLMGHQEAPESPGALEHKKPMGPKRPLEPKRPMGPLRPMGPKRP